MSTNTEAFRGWIPTVSHHRKQKADVAEHPKVFDRVGLLANEPPDRVGVLFI
jgi:hypothetical protein